MKGKLIWMGKNINDYYFLLKEGRTFNMGTRYVIGKDENGKKIYGTKDQLQR